MSDPTAIVLTSGFAAAFGIFVVSAAVFRAKDPSSPTVAEDGVILPPPFRMHWGKVPVWFYQHVDLVGAAFVFMVYAGLVLSAVYGEKSTEQAVNPTVLGVNIGFQFVMAGVVAVFALRRVHPATWLGLKWREWPWVILIAPCCVLIMWAIFGGMQVSGYLKWMESLGVETVQDTVQLLKDSSDPLILGLMAFAAVVAAPVCEEIVFRGFFYPVLKHFSGAWPAAICSAIVFSGAHGSLTAFLPLFLFGLLLVLVYEKTGSIWAPMSVHFCFNGATVIIQLGMRILDLPTDPHLEPTP
jgi:membrane protease YdiL (CAAX protease family)